MINEGKPIKLQEAHTGDLVFLVCPYSKIWGCLYDVVRQLVDKIG